MSGLMVPVDNAGRVVLPKRIREELAIKPGDRLKISIRGNAATLSPTKNHPGFIKRGCALVFSCEGSDLLDNDAVEAIRAKASRNRLSPMNKGLETPSRK